MPKPKRADQDSSQKRTRISKKMYEDLQAENESLRETIERYKETNRRQLDRLVGEELLRIQVRELKEKIAKLEERLSGKEP